MSLLEPWDRALEPGSYPFGRIHAGEAPHHSQQRQRSETRILAAGCPADGGQGKPLVELSNIDVVARLGSGRQSQRFVGGGVEKVQSPSQYGIAFYGKESIRRIGSPVDLDNIPSATMHLGP